MYLIVTRAFPPELKGMRNNVVNIEFLKEQTSKLQEDVEKLIRNGNGH